MSISKGAYYTAKEVSVILGLSYRTVRRQAEKGIIPSEKIGKKVKIPKVFVADKVFGSLLNNKKKRHEE